MIDLILIDENTSVLGDEVAIQSDVHCGALGGKNGNLQWQDSFKKMPIHHKFTVPFWHSNEINNSSYISQHYRLQSYQWGMVKGT